MLSRSAPAAVDLLGGMGCRKTSVTKLLPFNIEYTYIRYIQVDQPGNNECCRHTSYDYSTYV